MRAQISVPVTHRADVIITADCTPSVGVTVCPPLREKARVDKTAMWAAKHNSTSFATEHAVQPRHPTDSWCTF